MGASSLSSRPLGLSALETLWTRFAEIYGHKWSSSYGAEPNDTWAKGLAGISGEQIAVGLRACLTSADPWPPTLPQFRAMCLGIPEFSTVNAQICRSCAAPPTPFGRMVWHYLDAYRWRHSDSDRAERLLRAAYEEARQAVMQGEPMPPEPVAEIEKQAEPPKKPADPAVVKEALDKLQRIFDGMEAP
jgi:hypothetical protein